MCYWHAAIGTNFINNPWALAFIGAPLWGLLCYQTQLLVLASVRVNSISILEKKLLEQAQLEGHEKNQIGSDAGDRISRASKQPTGLRAANYASFSSIAVASIAIALTALMLVKPKCSFVFIFGVITHAVLAIIFTFAVISLLRIKALISDLANKGPYYPTEQDPMQRGNVRDSSDATTCQACGQDVHRAPTHYIGNTTLLLTLFSSQ